MFSQNKKSNFFLIVSLILIASILQIGVLRIPPHILILLLVSSFIFFIAFFKPDVAIIILIFSMLLSPEVGLGGVTGRSIVLRFDDFFIFMLFFGWLARMAINKELGLLRITPINQPILAYILICIIATTYGILMGTTSAKSSLFYVLKYIEYFMLFFFVSNNIHSKQQIKAFLFYLFLTCLIVGIYAVFFSTTIRASAPFEGAEGEPNTLAGYLIVIMGAMLGIILYSRSPKIKIPLIGLFAFSIYPLLQTLSRAGWMGFAGMFVSAVFLSKRYKGVLIIILTLFALSAPIVIPSSVKHRVKQTFKSGRTYTVMGKKVKLDESAGARYRSWQSAFDEWKDHPILGSGVASGRVLHDMQYGRVIREVGTIGMIAFIWMIVRLFVASWHSFKDPNLDDFGRGLCLGFICQLVGLLVMGVGAEVFIIIRIMEPFWFLAAIVVILPELEESTVPV